MVVFISFHRNAINSWTSNPEVPGSIPGGDAFVVLIKTKKFFVKIICTKFKVVYKA